jgi:hypothetical protein
MRSLTFLLASTLLAGAAPAAGPKQSGRGDTVVYVSVASEKRIAVYGMDRATGRLTHRGDAKLDGEPGPWQPTPHAGSCSRRCVPRASSPPSASTPAPGH